jgi:hypothetical protein
MDHESQLLSEPPDLFLATAKIALVCIVAKLSDWPGICMENSRIFLLNERPVRIMVIERKISRPEKRICSVN